MNQERILNMSKALVLAEKPSVGRDLARVLHCNKKGNGYYEGSKYIVTWALGHLVTLAEPEKYNDKYKSWKLEDLPMLPSNLKLVVIGKTSKQFNTVKKQMLRKDVDQIIIATDAGREGELVARWIIEMARVNKPIKRLWISSVTDQAIKEGFSKLKDGKAYEKLFDAAVARSEADWYVGMNATRALTCKYNAQLSAGRVQTPTLGMIAQREEKIKRFRSKPYYGIKVRSKNLDLAWQDGASKDIKTFDRKKRDQVVQCIEGKNVTVIEVKKVFKKSYAPKLYDLTELQRDANRIFDFSAKETLSIMQSLYERHKVLTYPRTDSRYITSDLVATLRDRIKACAVGPYSKIAMVPLKSPIKSNTTFVNNTKVSDHHAIIPTEQSPTLRDFNDRERKIYDLVVKRFLSILYPPFEYEQTSLQAKIGKEIFIAKGNIVKSKGWKAVYDNNWQDQDLENDDLEQELPPVNKGDLLPIRSIVKTEGKTKPPAPFNEGTLLSAMENPSKYMEVKDKDLRKTLGETGGLGTVATRADIIEKLFKSFLVEKKGKDIFTTSKGRQLLELVPEDLKSPALTGEWEQNLELISKGELNKNAFISQMKDYSKEIVREIKNSQAQFKHDNITRNKCPECKKFLLEVKSKRGKMLVCQDRECGYRKGISILSNARCPNCRKKMELLGQGDGKIFACKCGYREKLTSFNKRKSHSKNKASKREVNQYLNKKQKEEPINTALADALSKLDL